MGGGEESKIGKNETHTRLNVKSKRKVERNAVNSETIYYTNLECTTQTNYFSIKFELFLSSKMEKNSNFHRVPSKLEITIRLQSIRFRSFF